MTFRPRYTWLVPLLTLALVLPHPLPAAPAPDIAGQLIRIPAGTPVEFKLRDKSKLVGRLGPLGAGTVEVQVADGGMVKTRSLQLDEVASVKRKDRRGPSAGHIGLYLLGGFGIAVLVVSILLFSGAD